MVPRGCPKGWFWNRTTPPKKKPGIYNDTSFFLRIQPKDFSSLCFSLPLCQGEEKAESASVTLWVMSLGPVGGVSPDDMEPWYCVIRQNQRVFWDGQGWPLEAIFIIIMTCCSRGMPMNCRRLFLEIPDMKPTLDINMLMVVYQTPWFFSSSSGWPTFFFIANP